MEVRVWDSTADVRYLVLPQRPDGTEGMTEEQLYPKLMIFMKERKPSVSAAG